MRTRTPHHRRSPLSLIPLSLILSLLAFASLSACSAAVTPSEPKTSSASVGASPARHQDPTGNLTVPSGGDAVSVELRAPKRVRWVSATLGPTKPTLSVLVTNQGASNADVSNLHVHLEAVREGVSFRCAANVGAPPNGMREPAFLAPGAAFLFERTLDCSLPLAGNYAVSVSVSFGHSLSTSTWATPRPVRSFALAVHVPDQIDPKPIDAIAPGVWGAVGASRVLDGEAGRGGSGRIGVLLVNGGSRIVPLPRLRLALRVYREGSPIPCEDAPIDLHVPASKALDPGGVHREAIEVSCLGLGVPGNYDVAARLLIGEELDATRTPSTPSTSVPNVPNEVELGRLRIEISGDPVRPGGPAFTTPAPPVVRQ